MSNYRTLGDEYLNNETEVDANNEINEEEDLEIEQVTGTNNWGTVFLMINATLGAGLLNFPQAFDKSGGIVAAVSVQLAFLIFITASLIILAKCSDLTGTTSMQTTVAGLCGPKSLFLCSACIAIYSFGCCLTFVIIIGDQFDRVFATYYGPNFCHLWYMSRPFVTTTTCSLFILPLCFFKRLDVLSYASSLGCFTIVYVVWLIVQQYFKSTATSDVEIPVKVWPDEILDSLHIVPIICFAYQSHMTAIPTYACMKRKTIGSFTVCAIVSMIICFVAYSVVGIFGYATFGIDKVPSDILQGYTDKSVFIATAVVSIAIKNFTTYPIVLFCGRDAMTSMFGTRDADSTFVRVFTTSLWFALSVAVAILVPDISPVINFLGTLSAAFIFLIPGVCLLQSTLVKDPLLYLNKNRFLIVLGIFITTLGAFVCGIIFVEAFRDINKKPVNARHFSGFRVGLGDSLCTV